LATIQKWKKIQEDVSGMKISLNGLENHSKSIKGVLRGLHYQTENTQGKLVRVVSGAVFDVAVDMREFSPTFGQWVGEILSVENKRQLWVPEGFAHGFYVLTDEAEFTYKCTDYYNPKAEHSLIWNDETVGIEWPLEGEPSLSAKDLAGKHSCYSIEIAVG